MKWCDGAIVPRDGMHPAGFLVDQVGADVYWFDSESAARAWAEALKASASVLKADANMCAAWDAERHAHEAHCALEREAWDRYPPHLYAYGERYAYVREWVEYREPAILAQKAQALRDLGNPTSDMVATYHRAQPPVTPEGVALPAPSMP